MSKQSRLFRFQIALSFPGEHRARVERIAQTLAQKLGRSRILYDKWHDAEFARANLDLYLPKLYHEDSRLLVFFLCNEYNAKEWCGLEWRAGRDLLKQKKDERLMFLRLDDASIPGLYSTDGYIDINLMSPADVADRILARLGRTDISRTPDIDRVVQELRTKTTSEVRARCGKIRILTMEQPIALGGVYTEVNFLEKRTANERKSADDLTREAVAASSSEHFESPRQSGGRVPGLHAINAHQRLIIYGKPGAGKTTFLKRLAMECIDGGFRPDLVPAYVVLRDFADTHSPLSLSNYINTQWAGAAASESVLSEGRALLLLDGLDEVRNRQFDNVRKAIEEFANKYSRCFIALTCRIAAREYSFEQFTEVEMADFNKAQIDGFAKRWFGLLGEPLRGEVFIAKLEGSRPLFQLATIPLLLTLLCLVFEERNDFEGTRAELYKEGLDILLRKWDAKRGIERERPYGLSLSDMETLLGEIAFQRFVAAEYFFEKESLESQISSFFSQRTLLKHGQELVPERVLNSMEAHLGILVQRAMRVYSFSHLSFQEYLTAQRIARKITLISGIGHYFGDRRWREVWLLLATMVDADDIIFALKKQCDQLIERKSTIRACLQACHERATRTAEYRQPALRAFYVALILHGARRNTAGARALARDLALARALDPSMASDLAVELALTDALDGALAVQKALDKISVRQPREAHSRSRQQYDFRDLARDLLHNLARSEEAIKYSAPTLASQLGALRNELPKTADTVAWVRKWAGWYRRLATLSELRYDLGSEWGAVANQSGALREYFDATLLLMECMTAARGLTNKMRGVVEESLLLPSVESTSSS